MILQNTKADDTAWFLVVSGIIAAGSGIHFLRERLFPRFNVLISQGVRGHKVIEKVQWSIVIDFVVCLMSRIVVAIMK